MKRRYKRIVAFVVTIAMLLTSVNLTGTVKKAKAWTAPPESDLRQESCLAADAVTVSTPKAVDANGIIQNITNLDAKYYKVEFQVDKASGEIDDSLKLFNFQPYDAEKKGYQDNFLTFGEAAYDDERNSYVAFAKTADIIGSYTNGATVAGIQVSFCQPEPKITLTGLYVCNVKTPQGTQSPEDAVGVYDLNGGLAHETIQQISLAQICKKLGNQKYSKEKVGGNNIVTYLKITKSSRYSYIKVRAGNIVTNSYSNKELRGIDCTKYSSNNSPRIIHAGWGTGENADTDPKDGYGSGLGEAKTGIYELASSNVKKGSSSEDSGIRVTRRTNDVEAYIYAIKFDKIGTIGLSKPDENGDVTITDDFKIDEKLESQTEDATDIEPLSIEQYKEEIAKLVATAEEKKADILSTKVKAKLQELIDAAKAEAAKEEPVYTEIRNAHTALDEYLNGTVAAEAERITTREGLKASIDYCESLKKADYINEETFDRLPAELATAQAVYADTDLDRLAYKIARDVLEKVRVSLVKKVSTEPSSPKDFRILSKDQVVKEMGAGINLGNTMDGGLINPSETGWQAYKTTKEFIKAMHDAGYNTVRIPVTWNGYINEDYSIDEQWIGRVQEIVDYCIDQDMYAVINIHHDGAANHDNRGDNTPACWLDTYAQNIETVYQKYEGVWRTIANRFKDYDEHLIFESMNEVTDAHGTAANEDDAVLSALNQLFINTVRSTGSNNTKRWLAITGRFATMAGIDEMPEDLVAAEAMAADAGEVKTTRLMAAVHIYKNNTSVRWTYSNLADWQSSLNSTVTRCKKLDPDMPVYVGEYGVRTKQQTGSKTGYNNAERALNYEYCAAVADCYGAVPMVWDQGCGNYADIEGELSKGLFFDWNRPAFKPVFDDVVFGTVRGTLEAGRSDKLAERTEEIYKSYGHETTGDNGVSTDPEITAATDITLSDTVLDLMMGERKTISGVSDSPRDIVLWSTGDDSIATVYNGMVHAKGIGMTTVYATTQSGAVQKEIKVIVKGTGSETATAITTDNVNYEIKEGESVAIQTKLTPEDSTDAISYTSSNTEVATVDANGKVTGNKEGQTYIIIKAASGISTIVSVNVSSASEVQSVNVTLNVLYSASAITDKSAPLAITKDGQYTITYDMATDQSADSKKAGISDISGLTAIYLKDVNTTENVVTAAQIRYDKVVVNDTELTMKKTAAMDEDGFKSALKAGGQFDTNDPINGWDGSAVEEVTTDSNNHSVSFSTVTNPTKISVTFTIKGLTFVAKETKTKPVQALESVTKDRLVIPTVGDTAELEVKMTPADTDSELTFYSADSSIVVVDSTAKRADAEGKVKATITGVSEGETTIVGISENGKKVLYRVAVGQDKTAEQLETPKDPTPEGLGEKIAEPTEEPTIAPTDTPTEAPSKAPTETPTNIPTNAPTKAPTEAPTSASSDKPGSEPTSAPENVPTVQPSAATTVSTTPAPQNTSAAAPATGQATEGAAAKNPCKKVKAVRSSVTIKRGKTKKLFFTLTNQTKKKKTTDQMKVLSNNKLVQAKITKKAATKVVVKVTVKKKAKVGSKAKITLQVGKKKAKTVVKIK